MQNTHHYLATFSPKMRPLTGSITGTVSITDSTVYSEVDLPMRRYDLHVSHAKLD